MSAVAAVPGLAATLDAEGLHHRYRLGRGLEPVSFSLSAPGAAAVTGANGSGKSTLLRIVAGLLRPTGGTCRLAIDGAAITVGQCRERVGFASPDLSFYDELSVEENLKFAAEARGLRDVLRSVGETLDLIGLGSRAPERVATLSSGMKQRLRLGFALLHQPAVLLLDEPGSHLDEPGRTLVRTTIERHRRSGLVVFATNDEQEWRLADQRIELRGGGLGHPA